jgi:hypothetical protein
MDHQKLYKKRRISKDSLIFFILLLTFASTYLVQQNLYYNTKENYIIPSSVHNSNNQTNHEFDIYMPNLSLNQPLPAVILLNGDFISSRSLNLLKNEFLRNGFVVVLAEIKIYNNETFTILDSILDITKNQDFIDPSRIGIMGHSRGAHFALHFADINEDSIKAVICGNFGQIHDFVFLTDYLYYDHTFYPRNVLLITDYYDSHTNFHMLI